MRIVLAHGGDLSVPSGGHERIIAFATGLADHGHEVAVVVPSPEASLPECLDGIDIRPVDVPTGGVRTQPRRGIAITRAARRLANQWNARLQVEHSTLAGVTSVLGGGGYVVDMHDVAFASPLYRDRPLGKVVSRGVRWVEGQGLRSASDVVVVSERMASFVAETWSVPSDAITVVPNGYFETSVEGVKPETHEGTRVVFVGTLHPKLDVEAVIDCAQVSAVDELLVVGDGPMHSKLARAKHNRSLDSLSLPGRLSTRRTWSLVAGADVAINPQRQSPTQAVSSPVKLCYYRALGVPMVLSDGPDLARAFANDGIALLVGPNEDFAARLASLLSDAPTFEAMRSHTQSAPPGPSWMDRAETLCRVYE